MLDSIYYMRKIRMILSVVGVPLLFLAGFVIVTDLLYVYMNVLAEEAFRYSPFGTLYRYVYFLSAALCSYSLMRHIVQFNAYEREEYLARRDASSDLSWLFHRRTFYLQNAVIAAFYLIAPLKYTFTGLYETVAVSGDFADKLISLAILFPSLGVTGVLGRLSAYKNWSKDPEPVHYGIVKNISNAFLMLAAYYFGPVILTRIISIAIVLAAQLEPRTIIGIAVAVAVMIAVLIAQYVIRMTHKRRRFIKELKGVCAKKRGRLSEIKEPYLSGYVYNDKENFRITLGDKSYSCKFISCRSRLIPLVILRNGDIAFKYIIRIRGVEFYNFSTVHKTSHKADCQRIMILSPAPRIACAATGTSLELLDNGMRAGGYKIYTASSFIRAVELDALDKD